MSSMNWNRPRVIHETCEGERALAEFAAKQRAKRAAAIDKRTGGATWKGRAKWVLLPNGTRVHASKVRTLEDYNRAVAASEA